MIRFVSKVLILALCSAGHAQSSSTLRDELTILRQLSQNVDVQVPSRSPAFPVDMQARQDEVSLSQAAPKKEAPQNTARPEGQHEGRAEALQEGQQQAPQKRPKRRPGGPLYRGR